MRTTSDSPVNVELIQLPHITENTQRKTCAHCGQWFIPVSRGFQKYCCRTCKNRAYAASGGFVLAEERRKQKLQARAAGILPPIQPRTQRDEEAIQMYVAGKSFVYIAQHQGRQKIDIRRLLMNVGLRKPNPIFVHKKGSGIKGLKARMAEMERIGATVYWPPKTPKPSEIKADDKSKMLRKNAASILRMLRRGERLQTACRTVGINWQRIYRFLGSRKSYAKLAERRRTGEARKGSLLRGTYTRQFKNESEFQSVVAKKLTALHREFTKEFQIPGTKNRADFLVGNTCIECKASGKTRDVLVTIGQLELYKTMGYEAVVLVPGDIGMSEASFNLLSKHGRIVSLEDIETLFTPTPQSPGIRILRDRISTIICKCCGRVSVPSKSRAKYKRSYCIDCAPRIPSMKFDTSIDKWITKHKPGQLVFLTLN